MAPAIANNVAASDASVCTNVIHVYANFDHNSECRSD
jgi:hypothetical protein